MRPDHIHPKLRRREALALAGAAGAGLVWTASQGWVSAAHAALTTPTASAAGACTLTKELTEGPYWIENSLTRRDITEGKHGAPLELVFTVQDASTCKVISGADVEVWHADAKGVYSGFSSASGPGSASAATTPQNSKRFLRGHQRTDANGRARFDTIYPGWYRGRTPHIHLKVHVGGNEVHTGQVFFPDRISHSIYRTRYYKSHGLEDTSNAADSIYDAGSLLTLTKRTGNKGYRGATRLAVDRS